MSDQNNRNFENKKNTSNNNCLDDLNSKSILWIKLYLQQYFFKTKSQIQECLSKMFDKVENK